MIRNPISWRRRLTQRSTSCSTHCQRSVWFHSQSTGSTTRQKWPKCSAKKKSRSPLRIIKIWKRKCTSLINTSKRLENWQTTRSTSYCVELWSKRVSNQFDTCGTIKDRSPACKTCCRATTAIPWWSRNYLCMSLRPWRVCVPLTQVICASSFLKTLIGSTIFGSYWSLD